MHPGLHCSKGQALFIRYRLVGLAQYVPEDDDPAGPVIQRLDRVLDELLKLLPLKQFVRIAARVVQFEAALVFFFAGGADGDGGRGP